MLFSRTHFLGEEMDDSALQYTSFAGIGLHEKWPSTSKVCQRKSNGMPKISIFLCLQTPLRSQKQDESDQKQEMLGTSSILLSTTMGSNLLQLKTSELHHLTLQASVSHSGPCPGKSAEPTKPGDVSVVW